MYVLHAHEKKCGQMTEMEAWESVFLDTASVTQPAQPVTSGTPVHQLSPQLNRGIFTQRTQHGAFSTLHYPLITLNTACAHLKHTSSHWVKCNSSFSYWPTLSWVWTPWPGRGSSLHFSSQDKRQGKLQHWAAGKIVPTSQAPFIMAPVTPFTIYMSKSAALTCLKLLTK